MSMQVDLNNNNNLVSINPPNAANNKKPKPAMGSPSFKTQAFAFTVFTALLAAGFYKDQMHTYSGMPQPPQCKKWNQENWKIQEKLDHAREIFDFRPDSFEENRLLQMQEQMRIHQQTKPNKHCNGR